MRRRVLQIAQYLVFLSIGIFLVWWSLHRIPESKLGEFKNSLLTANYWLFIPVFFILSASHWVRSIRWRILMKPMGYKPSIVNTFFAVMIGYFANLAVPRLGEVLKCTILAKYEKVPAEKLVGTIVAERAVDVLSLAIVFLLALVTQYHVIGAYAQELFQSFLTKKAASFSWQKGLFILTGLIFIVVIVIYLLRRLAHISLVKTIKSILKGIWEGVSSIKTLENKSAFLFHTVLIWVLYITGTLIGLYATSGTAHLGLPEAISGLALASLGMILTPGGIGAYAYFLAIALEKNQVPFEIGYANGTLQWFAQFIIVLVIGFISIGLLPILNKQKNN